MSEIRELAMRLAKDAGFIDYRSEQFQIEIERLVRAAMREAYKTASLSVVIRARKVEAANTYRGRVNNVAQFAADQLQEAANAIRAEADKLEGK